jgi:hypothetical protein
MRRPEGSNMRNKKVSSPRKQLARKTKKTPRKKTQRK